MPPLVQPGPKALHWLRIALLGHRHPMGVDPHINPRGMEIALLELRCTISFAEPPVTQPPQ